MDSINAEADDIASAITKILIKAFVAKEGRDPTNDEVQMLIEELTEERIESMLNGEDSAEDKVAEENAEDDGEEDKDDEEENAVEEATEPKATEMDNKEESYVENLKPNDKSDASKRQLTKEGDENDSLSADSKKARVFDPDSSSA